MRALSALAATALVATVVLAGCSSDPAKVSKDDVARVEAAADDLKMGSSKSEVMSQLEYGQKKQLSSSTVAGVAVEEWRLDAVHDDDWSKKRTQYVRFLYFANGKLVQVSDKRIDYQTNPEVVKSWAGK